MRSGKFGSFFRRWSRTVHRELSFFFGGVVLIYAISGFLLNHKRDTLREMEQDFGKCLEIAIRT